MIAYHGNAEIKAAILDQLRAHAAADEIVKGQYWEDGKGCAVGCAIHSDEHAEYESRFGIPQMLARLEDSISRDCRMMRLKHGRFVLWRRFVRAPIYPE